MSTMTLQHTPRPVARPAARPARPESGVRLTSRGRLVVFALGFAVVVLAAVLWSAGSAATSEAEQTETITVGTGDTLWDIAAERAGDGDVRAMIAEIQGLNDLEGGMLVAGDRLEVPAG